MTHAFALIVALVLSGYATLDRHLPAGLSLRLGAVNAEGLVIGEGGETGSVQLGRLGTIIKPIAIPTTPIASHSPSMYEVKDGETLGAIASRHHISVESIRWSNYEALKNVTREVGRGDRIVVPPVDGVAVLVKEGDTPQGLADYFHADPGTIIDYNYLRTPATAPLVPNSWVVVPGGRGPDFARPAAPSILQPASGFRSSPGYTVGLGNGSYSASAGNRFAWGYCTWYAYNKRPVPWLGNAWEWFGNAQRAGWATGQSPRPGALMVTWESSFGHVAYVESVGGDGSWTVSEMNFRGFGVVSTRTIRPGGVPLIGFIY